MDTTKIHDILNKYWGFSSFREKQEEIITSILNGKDTLALLPTGGGKSICFQVPAIVKEGICLVISPLIALMHDQVENLKRRGIKAIAITSGMSKREIDISLDNAAYGNFKFLYVSPERLETELFKERLKKMNISLVAIDEAHCISQWGHDFRPAYLNISKLKEQLKGTPFMALTATATPKVVEDIQQNLKFNERNIIQKSFARSNLAYVIINAEGQNKKILDIINGVEGSGVIYVSTRKKTKEICIFLRDHKISADFYHAGLSYEDRSRKQNDWIENRSRVMIATNAFGMGIDKANVRFVIHLDLPETLEAYFQEAGRAGRDEKKAYAALILSPNMIEDLKQKIEKTFPSLEKIKQCYLALGNHFQIPLGGGEGEKNSFDIREFSKKYELDVQETFSCLKILVKEGLIYLSEGYLESSRLYIPVSHEDLYKYQVANKSYDFFIKTVLRTYGGVFEDFIKINEYDIAKNSRLSKNEVIKKLKFLEKLKIVEYETSNGKSSIVFLKPRVDQRAIKVAPKNYTERKKLAKEKFNAVRSFVLNNNSCRSQILLRYFGEKDSLPCGVCDVCLEIKKKNINNSGFEQVERKIKQILNNQKATSAEIIKKLGVKNEKETLKTLSFLVDNERIITDGYQYWSRELNGPNID